MGRMLALLIALFYLSPSLAFGQAQCVVDVEWTRVHYLGIGDDIGDDWRFVVVIDGSVDRQDVTLAHPGTQTMSSTFQTQRGTKPEIPIPIPDVFVPFIIYATELDFLVNDYSANGNAFGPYACGSGPHNVEVVVPVQELPGWFFDDVALIKFYFKISLDP